MTLRQLIKLAKAYQDLGGAVQRQLDDIQEGELKGHNGEALKLISQWVTLAERLFRSDVALQDDIQLTREDIGTAHISAD